MVHGHRGENRQVDHYHAALTHETGNKNVTKTVASLLWKYIDVKQYVQVFQIQCTYFRS